MVDLNREDRAYPRQPLMRIARIKIAPEREIACVLHNISRTGAMISVEDPSPLPKRFILDMSGNIVVQRVCELVWQEGHEAGVKFAILNTFQSIQFNLD